MKDTFTSPSKQSATAYRLMEYHNPLKTGVLFPTTFVTFGTKGRDLAREHYKAGGRIEIGRAWRYAKPGGGWTKWYYSSKKSDWKSFKTTERS